MWTAGPRPLGEVQQVQGLRPVLWLQQPQAALQVWGRVAAGLPGVSVSAGLSVSQQRAQVTKKANDVLAV